MLCLVGAAIVGGVGRVGGWWWCPRGGVVWVVVVGPCWKVLDELG